MMKEIKFRIVRQREMHLIQTVERRAIILLITVMGPIQKILMPEALEIIVHQILLITIRQQEAVLSPVRKAKSDAHMSGELPVRVRLIVPDLSVTV